MRQALRFPIGFPLAGARSGRKVILSALSRGRKTCPHTVRLTGSSGRTATKANGPHYTCLGNLSSVGKSSLFALLDIGMSYVPIPGRFLYSDPVNGGNVNDYVYPCDPINSSDLDGYPRHSNRHGSSAGVVAALVVSQVLKFVGNGGVYRRGICWRRWRLPSLRRYRQRYGLRSGLGVDFHL